MSNPDRIKLEKREGGYKEEDVTVYLQPTSEGDFKPLHAFTFIAAAEECPHRCGPPPDYLDIVIQGAKERKLPAAYQAALQAERSNSSGLFQP